MKTNIILRRLVAWFLVAVGLVLMATVAHADITSIFIQNGPTDDGTNITATLCTDGNQNNDTVYVQFGASLTPTEPIGVQINSFSPTPQVCTRDNPTVGSCTGNTYTCSFIKPAGTFDFRYLAVNNPGNQPVVAATGTSTAVELVSFDAMYQPGAGIALHWETATEIDHAGFNVYRGSQPTFDRASATQINAELIAPQGSFGQGAGYSLIDNAVPAGVWYYHLEDVDIYGAATVHDPVRVDLSQPTSAALTGMAGNAPGGWAWLVLGAAGALLFLFVAARAGARGSKRLTDR